MNKIYCLMGKSNSGKDSILHNLFTSLNHNPVDLKTIVTYTTRPIRIGEKNGVDYYFVNEDKMLYFMNNNKIIEYRTYNTVKGVWYYATVDDGQIDLTQNSYISIVDIKGYKEYIKYFGEQNVVGIYLDVDNYTRLTRALNREHNQSKPDYLEMCRRFIEDEKDFDKDTLDKLNIKIYLNNDLEECLNQITYDIKHGVH